MEDRGKGSSGFQHNRKPRRGRGSTGSRSPSRGRGQWQGSVPPSPADVGASTSVSSPSSFVPDPPEQSSSPAPAAPTIEVESTTPTLPVQPPPEIPPVEIAAINEPESVSLPAETSTDLERSLRETEVARTLEATAEAEAVKELRSPSKPSEETSPSVMETPPKKPIRAQPAVENLEFTQEIPGTSTSSSNPIQPRVLVIEKEKTPKSFGSHSAPQQEIKFPLEPSPSTSATDSRDDDKPTPATATAPVRKISDFSYGLGGPVGKPGYIGSGPRSYTGSESDDPWDEGRRSRSRQASAIAGMSATIMGFSKRQWITLLIFGLADFFSAIVISLQAPFYPAEAEKKGATATEYGLVFGIFELTVFIMSPIYGKYMNKLGPKLTFNAGIFTTATCCILFGLLDNIEDHTMFITLSFIVRIVEAIGNAAFVTAAFTIIACEFPESVATTFASLETFWGLGLIVGPTMGGALYQLGGYYLPFVVTGASLFTTAFLAAIIMPKSSVVTDENGKQTDGYGIFSILKIPAVFLSAISIMVAASSIGFLSATLEPHLRQFGLTPLQTGLVFIINGGIYALTAPGFGWLSDRISQPKYIMLAGAVFGFVSFLLIGPAPFIPLDTILWLSCVGLVVHGLCLGATLVSGFIIALKDSMDNGFPDNISTYGVVSGLWTSMLSLGAFVGPSIGGILLDNVGFRLASLFLIGGELLVMALVLVFILFFKKPGRQHQSSDSEAEPLLRSISPLRVPKEGKSQPSSYGATAESDA